MVASFWLATSSSHNPSTVFGKEEDPEIRRMKMSVKFLQRSWGFILPRRSETVARSLSRMDTPVVAVPVVGGGVGNLRRAGMPNAMLPVTIFYVAANPGTFEIIGIN
jgi:hypothetical protein